MYILYMQINCKAPAKVNLHLEIASQRDDGFHEIISIMQMVSLFDVISIRSLEGKNGMSLEGPFHFQESENTMRRAYQGFQRRLGLNFGLEVSVQKNIPYGAGLGGGSSDAATFLRCLNLLQQRPLHERELDEIGLEIGSDVPFFLGSAAALVTGRGENITPLKARSDFRIMLVYPGFPIETRKAYEWLDQSEDRKGLVRVSATTAQSSELSKKYAEANVASWRFINSFEKVLFERFPVLKEIQSHLRELGAVHCGISGSGSTVIGIFPVEVKLGDVMQAFGMRYPFAATVEPLESKPNPILK